MTEDDPDEDSTRERAQALRDALADTVDAPAQQDEHAARSRQVEGSNGDGAGSTDDDDGEGDAGAETGNTTSDEET